MKKPKRPRYPSDNLKRATITMTPALERRLVEYGKDHNWSLNTSLRMIVIGALDRYERISS